MPDIGLRELEIGGGGIMQRETWAERPPRGPIARPPPAKPLGTAVGLLGLLYAMDHWAPPLLRVTANQRDGGPFGWGRWGLDAIARLIKPGVRYMRHEVSKAATHDAAAPTLTLDHFAWRYQQTVTMLGHLGITVAAAVERLVHHKIPQMIRVRTRPLEIRTKRLRVGQIRLSHDFHTLNAFTRTQLRNNIKPRLGRLETRVFRRLPLELGRIRLRLRRTEARQARDHHDIQKMRWAAAFAGAVPLTLYAFRRLRIQSLLCRNTRGFTEEVCAMPSGFGRLGGRFLRELVVDFMGFLGIISVVAFANELFGFLTDDVPGTSRNVIEWVQHGLEEISGLEGSDYLGDLGGVADLLAPDYLDA